MGVFCSSCVYVRDSFVMYCAMVRGWCLCVLSLCVRVLNLCVVCISLCGVVCGFQCARCVCVRVSMGLLGLFVACCAVLFGLPLMLVVLCSCVFVGHA